MQKTTRENELWRLFPHTFAQVASRGRWKPYPYLKYISQKISQGVHRGNARIIVSLPPRHGKSEFCSVWTPVWFLEMYEEKRIILASYAAELASTFGRKVRNEIESNASVTSVIAQDSTAAYRFNTAKGGGMTCAGVGGAITGKGADLFLIDDPYKDSQQATSETYRQRLTDWLEQVALTRLEPNGSMVLIMTRWHEKDLAGHLIEKGGWEEIRFPAIAEERDQLGRKPGEALCPERYDLEALSRIKKENGTRTWQALYQQSPQPLEGGLFKRHWWKTYRELPMDITRIVQFWDTAQKPGLTNDFSVCATWGQNASGFYLMDLWRNKVEMPDLERAVVSNFNKHRPHSVMIEDKASGIGVIQTLRQKTRLPIIAYDPKLRDKETRASAATPTVEAGNCYLPENAPWLEDFIVEHETFPNTEHDDQVDTTSMMVEYMNQRVAVARVTLL